MGTDEGPDSPAVRDALLARTNMYDCTDHIHKADIERWRPSVERISPEQLAELYDLEVMQWSQWFYEVIDPRVYRDHVRDAILGATSRDPTGKMIWPGLKVHVLWCDASISDTVYAALVLQAWVREAQAKGEGRDVRLQGLENANHFVGDPPGYSRRSCVMLTTAYIGPLR